jgi:hypothetical protein
MVSTIGDSPAQKAGLFYFKTKSLQFIIFGKSNAMTIVIHKKSTSSQIELAQKKTLEEKNCKKGVAQSFGALKRNIDGVKYQKATRNEWN